MHTWEIRGNAPLFIYWAARVSWADWLRTEVPVKGWKPPDMIEALTEGSLLWQQVRSMRRHSGRALPRLRLQLLCWCSLGRQETVEVLVCFFFFASAAFRTTPVLPFSAGNSWGKSFESKALCDGSIFTAVANILLILMITHDATNIQIIWSALILPSGVVLSCMSDKKKQTWTLWVSQNSTGINCTHICTSCIHTWESCCLWEMLQGLKEIITDYVPHLQAPNSCCSFLIAATRNYCFFNFFIDPSCDLHRHLLFSLISHGQRVDPSPLPLPPLSSLSKQSFSCSN